MAAKGRREVASWILCAALAILPAWICIRVEVLNCQAGGYLPRQPETESGNDKWRSASLATLREAMLRTYRVEANLPEGQALVLSPAQEQAIAAAQKKAVRWNDFREFVSTWGLAQYLIAPVTLITGIILASGRGRPFLRRAPGIAAACIAAVCIGLMLYRGYFSSLGW